MKPVRISRLKLFGKSAAHYKGAEDQDEYHLERGDGLHSVLLGGKRVIAYPGAVRRGKEYDAFVKDNPGALILTKTEEAKVNAMAASVRRHPVAMRVLKGQHELEVDWTFLGRPCQSHIDVLGPGGAYVTELKSAKSSKPLDIMWQSLRLGYNAQLAFYDEAVRTLGLGKPTDHYVVAVESAPPFVVTVLRLTDRALDQGRRAFRLWFEQLLACEEADRWPGYCEAIEDLDLPVEDDVELVFPAAADDDQEAA
jgi:hypothetical protein